jgi:hypothetical protein
MHAGTIEEEYIEEESSTNQGGEEFEEYEEVSISDHGLEELEVADVRSFRTLQTFVDTVDYDERYARTDAEYDGIPKKPQSNEHETRESTVDKSSDETSHGCDELPQDEAQTTEQRDVPVLSQNKLVLKNFIESICSKSALAATKFETETIPTPATVHCSSVESQIVDGVRSRATNGAPNNTSNIPISSTKALEVEKPSWTCVKLKSVGKDLKKGEDLEAPITHIPKNNMDDINFEANPLMLRPTKKGFDVRLGENLAKPITHHEKNPNASVNSVASTSLLKRTPKGEIIVGGADLQKPITHVEKDNMDDINFEANPLILKSTMKGTEVRLGGKLERPITLINEIIPDK